MKLITAIVQTEKLEDVQRALIKNGIQGMTMTEVYGHGRQRGHVEVYRGAEFTIDFIQKVRIEVLVKDVDAERVIEVMVEGARTGEVGDGKVWALDVDTVVRVRTGERDDAAL